MGKWPEALKKANIQAFFLQKNRKKKLDKGVVVWYISRARPPERAQERAANLENDTEERNAQEGKISEDSKELSIERCLRIKRKSLILAQDERWRRA